METSSNNSQPTVVQMTSGLTISVSEARKILGDDALGLSDEMLTVLILSLTEIAHQVLLLTDDGGLYNE